MFNEQLAMNNGRPEQGRER